MLTIHEKMFSCLQWKTNIHWTHKHLEAKTNKKKKKTKSGKRIKNTRLCSCLIGQRDSGPMVEMVAVMVVVMVVVQFGTVQFSFKIGRFRLIDLNECNHQHGG